MKAQEENKIDVNSFRRYNLVMVDGVGICRIYEIQQSNAVLIDLNNGHFPQYWEKIHPVPLTPDLLEKCGFVKCEQLSVMGSLEYTKPVGPEFHRKLLLTKNPLIANNWISHFITGDKLGSSLPTMEYLHQLQNLYFALTGKPLAVDVQKLTLTGH